MKLNSILNALLLLISFGLFGQSDQDQFPDKYKYFDINQYEQRTLFKVVPFIPRSIFYLESYQLDYVSFEQKLSRSISGEIAFYFPQENQFALEGKVKLFPSKLKYDEGNSQSLNNLTGWFTGLLYSRGTLSFNEDNAVTYQLTNPRNAENRIGLLVGFQEKIGRFFMGETSFDFTYTPGEFGGFALTTNAVIGFAWGPTKSLNDDENSSYGIREFNSKKLWITVYNPSIQLSDRFSGAYFSVGAEYEVLRNTSLLATFGTSWSRQSLEGSDVDRVTSSGLSASLSVRQYFLDNYYLKRGILKQSLTGPYAGFEASYGVTYRNGDGVFDIPSFNETWEGSDYYVHAGYQYRFGKPFFFDINLGGQYSTFSESTQFVIKTRIGLLINNK